MTLRRSVPPCLAMVLSTQAVAQDQQMLPFEDLPPVTIPLWGSGGQDTSQDPPATDLWSASRPDSHAPIGMMGDHTHEKGEWMVSLRYMQMYMGGMREGTDSLSSDDVLAEGYPVTPTQMTTSMVMLGGMYAPTDELTLTLMVPWLYKSMDHITGTGVRFTTRSEGIGDIVVGGLYKIVDADRQRVHLNLGLSLPTGSINERDDTPAMANAKLPYPMQLGTGTFDLIPGVTYLGQSDDWSWGGQGTYAAHLGENSDDWTKGNRLGLTAWGARKLSRKTSVSARLSYLNWDNISGADPDLNPAMVPTADPDLQGGQRLDVLVGINWYDFGATGNRLAIEFGVPIYQDLDGPQMEADWMLTAGWQLSF